MNRKDKWLESMKRESPKYGILPPPTEAQEALNVLTEHFLGESWYVVDPLCTRQVNTVALCEILKKYPSGKFRRIMKRR